ncbi:MULTISPECIES: hypothetical protein [Pseudomonas]|uniref:hypothetical protein n=1 Tax=Pseudomonas TaxID=286 RepID=UPI001EF0196E|nr:MULTISPECIES: hypothetical protein [Pseudomonas]MCF5691277.1 hypothetical protein [Pseudomonas sp. PA-1-8C]MCF5786281.1 hypothetical protein [Pseudomonas sp. PA-1-6G]MCF5796178.1 hypothetical protein [Pseudomonas sp. PA-1-5A]
MKEIWVNNMSPDEVEIGSLEQLMQTAALQIGLMGQTHGQVSPSAFLHFLN